jgi:hypothetical protein
VLTGLSGPEEGLGAGLDSCVLPTRHEGISIVQTTDFFYPLVEDPYMQGKIACANVLSDLYAMGVSECDNMLMLLGISENFTYTQRQVVTPMMIQGFTGIYSPVSLGSQTTIVVYLLSSSYQYSFHFCCLVNYSEDGVT